MNCLVNRIILASYFFRGGSILGLIVCYLNYTMLTVQLGTCGIISANFIVLFEHTLVYITIKTVIFFVCRKESMKFRSGCLEGASECSKSY